MSEDNHNHFCIYCGAKLVPNQHFCSQCGNEVYHDPEPQPIQQPSKYVDDVEKIAQMYNIKQSRAIELVEKLFDPTHMSYQKFTQTIKKSNGLFDNQLAVTRKMIELDDGNNEIIERELKSKIITLNIFVDKMEELINELVIQLSSNNEDDDINSLFKDMDDLIDSVKDY
ncbi:MAG: zinc ribbon domain-containing protein [Methanobrevibacter sp.]|uniref:zinc ribbon domain-containing protein n=1 Tax=Methanobrevibacter sp. TaxID=66852 RepID=UPI0025FF182D|nr:zinc ribbon domain-containing protein [Methanobrevibacter sp.]MBQ8016649.1 zinc ribbon domain-containing protein [Methanobrevibacter sp.]